MRSGSPGEKSRLLSALGWSLLVICISVACFLLYRTLSRVDFGVLWESVQDLSVARLLKALLFAGASYLCLTGFDYLAVRYIGRKLPYRRVALISFVSLSLGHNIGFAALSSGAIRYRFYARHGFQPDEVAKIILFCGVTVGLGLTTLAGLVCILKPSSAARILHFIPLSTPLLGCLLLALPSAYLFLAGTIRWSIGYRQWSFAMPSVGLALAQIVVGTANFCFVAACLHQVLAGVVEVQYLDVATVYVIANAASLVTHVPGGLGVIESIVAMLLPGAAVLGGALVFRAIYFLIPLVLGGTLLAVTELLSAEASGRATWRERPSVSARAASDR